MTAARPNPGPNPRPEPRPDPLREAAALLNRGRPADAADLADRAAARDPKNAALQQLLALARSALGERDRALFHAERAVALAPKDPGAHSALAQVALTLDDPARAGKHAEKALALRPGAPQLLEVLALARRATGDRAAALVALDQALANPPAQSPAPPSVAVLRGQILQELARPRDAVDALRDAARAHPGHADAHRRLGLALIHDDRATGRDIRDAHAAWGRLAEQALPQSPARAHRPDPDRLTVAYLSPDFRAHSVAAFIEPLLAHHDPARVRVLGYSTVTAPDAVTDRLRARCAEWRDLSAATDADLARAADDDRVDILVELSGHFAGHRLPALARRIAPVQVTYLGYPATTGLTRVDARLVDAVTDPPAASDDWATERVVRLDRCFLCYAGRPDLEGDGPDPDPVAPAVRTGRFTFGSFNSLPKVGPAVLDAWADILTRAPNAALRLKGYGYDDPGAVDTLLTGFDARGIDRARLMVSERTATLEDHLKMYAEIDLALDTFPYNGTTTTCEAAWMGVPTLTFPGAHHAARVGASINAALGLDDFTAVDTAAYVHRAAELAADPAPLAELRPALRDRMRTGPLMDGPAHARAVEDVYRALWNNHLGRTAAPG